MSGSPYFDPAYFDQAYFDDTVVAVATSTGSVSQIWNDEIPPSIFAPFLSAARSVPAIDTQALIKKAHEDEDDAVAALLLLN